MSTEKWARATRNCPRLFSTGGAPFRRTVRLLSWLVLAALPVAKGLAAEDCGAVREHMWGQYPVDYRSPPDKMLLSQAEGKYRSGKAKDLSELLKLVPNHPVALASMAVIARRAKGDRPYGSEYGMACWFDRAVRWRRDDVAVRMMYGTYLGKEGNYAAAIEQFRRAEELRSDSGNMAYNIGLMYFGLKDYDQALKYAHKAYQEGFDLPGLRGKLESVARWQPLPSSVREGAAKPERAATTTQPPSAEPLAGLAAKTKPTAPSHMADYPSPPEGEDCGLLNTGFLPWDYRTDKAMLPIVENYHFTYDVERLAGGATGPLPGDIAYTLNRFPNHPRALMAMMIYLGQPGHNKRSVYSPHSMECWLDRAIRWRPEDGDVRAIFGAYLAKHHRYAEAAKQFEMASQLGGKSPNSDYNLGLVYFAMKDYDKALLQAHKAYAGGFSLPGLRKMLEKAGKWQPLPSGQVGASNPLISETQPASQTGSNAMTEPQPAGAPPHVEQNIQNP